MPKCSYIFYLKLSTVSNVDFSAIVAFHSYLFPCNYFFLFLRAFYVDIYSKSKLRPMHFSTIFALIMQILYTCLYCSIIHGSVRLPGCSKYWVGLTILMLYINVKTKNRKLYVPYEVIKYRFNYSIENDIDLSYFLHWISILSYMFLSATL